jgi:hypothetical protein
MFRSLPLLLGFAVVCLFQHSIRGGERESAELALKTERVIVFKDGYSLIIKRGTATTDQHGEVFTEEVPDAAALGSFWAVPDEGRLISMVAGWKAHTDSTDKQVPCTQMIEILLANKGKQAKVEVRDKLLSGTILDVPVVRATVAAPPAPPVFASAALSMATARPALSHFAAPMVAGSSPGVETSVSSIGGEYFVLRTEDGDMFLPVGQITGITIKDMKTEIPRTFTQSKKTKRLSFRFEAANKKQLLSIMYFRPGVRWIPTYRVALDDNPKEKRATVALQAELLNEAEDIGDAPIDLVVGVPNFRFRGTPSPLVLEATLRNALAEAAPNLMGNSSSQLSNAMYSQRSGEFRREQAEANAVPEGVVNLPGELTAAGAQDLFVYSLPKLTLNKGERMAVPIFTAEVPYRDLYTWDVRVQKADNDAAPDNANPAPTGSSAHSPLALSTNEIWHQIVLTNNTRLPWTTGAVMIVQGNQPLAQELLTYTPPKDDVRVPLTVSVDTRGSLTERETGRDLNGLKWDGYNYARIDKQLRLDLCNNKPVAIETEITMRLGGKVDEASDEGKILIGGFNQADWTQYHGHPAVNNSSTVDWKTRLEPGANFEPTVNYHHFTRH